MKKVLFFSLGSVFVTLGLIGIFIPVLPTTPFLLLAAYFFARSSERALHWLLNNRWFGSYIRNYREGRGMALKDKIITLSSLWITIVLTAIFLVDNGWVRFVLAAVALGVTLHLLRIKTYQSKKKAHRPEKQVEHDQ